MNRQESMQARRLEKFARFLDEHPGFSPLLLGEDAVVCGFRVGETGFTIVEMDMLISTQPHFDAKEAAQLLAPRGRGAAFDYER
jgi:hypothetical protein